MQVYCSQWVQRMKFRTEKEEQLVVFMQETCGELLSLLLLTGLGENAWPDRRRFTVSEIDADGYMIRHRLELTSDETLPHDRDPLVLAALLKMLIERRLPYTLKCEHAELVHALGWRDIVGADGDIIKAVERYYTASLAEVESLWTRPGSVGTVAFVRATRFLIGYQTHGVELADGTGTVVAIFNPDFVVGLARRVLLGIDWKRVVAIEV